MSVLEANYAVENSPASQTLHPHILARSSAKIKFPITKTRNNGSRVACLTMVFKLLENAARTWRKLNGSDLLSAVVAGTIYEDGIQKLAA